MIPLSAYTDSELVQLHDGHSEMVKVCEATGRRGLAAHHRDVVTQITCEIASRFNAAREQAARQLSLDGL